MTLKDLYKSITRQEWKKILLWIIITIFITTLPFVYGHINTPQGKIQSGIRSLTSIDLNVYYSYIEQTKQGQIIFYDLFTGETQTPLIFNIFWLGVGLIGKISKLNNIVTFQIARILLIPIFISTIYTFISYFFTDKIKRHIALIFILFSSGIGAILAPILEKFVYESYGYYHWPIDMWVAESITFLTLFHMPHFIASLILIILIFLFILLAWETDSHPDKGELQYEILAGLCALLLFQFHPFHLPTIFGVLGAYFIFLCLINKKILFSKLRSLIILFLFTLPNLIYHLYILRDPIIKQRAIQNICLTPAWWLTIIGFGFLVPLALIGSYYILKNKYPINENLKNKKYYFLIIWLIIQTALIYSPTNLQRRMSEGLHIVLSLLALIAIFALIKKTKQKNKLSSAHWTLGVPLDTKCPSCALILKFLCNKLDKTIIYIYKNKILLIIIFIIFFSFSNIFNIARDIAYYNQEHILFYIPIEKNTALIG